MNEAENPHASIPFEVSGAALPDATLAVVMVHGRTLDAAYMREHVAHRLGRTDLAYIFPTAHGNSWYPESFLRPLAENQPRLDAALARMEDVRSMLEEAGVGNRRIVWLGFSQGACLVSEYVARSSDRFAGLVCFTGGLIGPMEPDLTRPTNVRGLPALFTTSDVDEWVPLYRVEETVSIFRQASADVEFGIARGTGHEIVDDSIERCRAILTRMGSATGHSSPPVA
jgi:phospholipase/carboxylesterase